MFGYSTGIGTIDQYQPGLGSLSDSPFDAGDDYSRIMLGQPRSRGSGATYATFVQGATYGQQKWNGSPYETDLFAPAGTPIKAPWNGTVEVRTVPGPPGNGPIYVAILRGENGISMLNAHVEPNIRQGRVRAGETFALVGTSGMDTLGAQSAHDHVAFSRSGQFGGPVGLTGDIPAVDYIEQMGFKGKKVARTPGPMELGMGPGGPASAMLGGGYAGMGSPYGGGDGGGSMRLLSAGGSPGGGAGMFPGMGPGGPLGMGSPGGFPGGPPGMPPLMMGPGGPGMMGPQGGPPGMGMPPMMPPMMPPPMMPPGLGGGAGGFFPSFMPPIPPMMQGQRPQGGFPPPMPGAHGMPFGY